MGADTNLQIVGIYQLIQVAIMVRVMAKGHGNLEGQL